MKKTPLKAKTSPLKRSIIKPGKTSGLKSSGKGLKGVSSLKKTSSLKAGDSSLKAITPMKKQNEKSKALWIEIRERALQRDNHKCIVCGKPATQVHHIHLRSKRKDLMYEINNLVSLCDYHHAHQSEEGLEKVNTWVAKAKHMTLDELLEFAEIKEDK